MLEIMNERTMEIVTLNKEITIMKTENNIVMQVNKTMKNDLSAMALKGQDIIEDHNKAIENSEKMEIEIKKLNSLNERLNTEMKAVQE